jgi:hypothetical protein
LPDNRRRLLERSDIVDMARKVGGVGGIGTRAFIVLLLRRDAQDPLLPQSSDYSNGVADLLFLGGTEGN